MTVDQTGPSGSQVSRRNQPEGATVAQLYVAACWEAAAQAGVMRDIDEALAT